MRRAQALQQLDDLEHALADAQRVRVSSSTCPTLLVHTLRVLVQPYLLMRRGEMGPVASAAAADQHNTPGDCACVDDS